MSASYFDLLKYAATGQASPDMTYYDKMRASTLMGGAVQTLTGQPPLSFKADGTPLISWSMKGNGQQTGTPTPDNPVMPTFCGKLVGADWTIPITCAGQTVPVYLGEVQTVRRVRKLVLDGTENWKIWAMPSSSETERFYINVSNIGYIRGICSHFPFAEDSSDIPHFRYGGTKFDELLFWIDKQDASTVADFKAYLASEYAAGHPVTVWYVLANEQTGIVNEPLCKIGDYADELSSEDASVTIPTAKGQNALTVDTELQPSEMTITFKG